MSLIASSAMIRHLLPVLLLAATAPQASGQDAADVLEGLFAAVDGDDRPGCAVMVTYGGIPLYEQGFGPGIGTFVGRQLISHSGMLRPGPGRLRAERTPNR